MHRGWLSPSRLQGSRHLLRRIISASSVVGVLIIQSIDSGMIPVEIGPASGDFVRIRVECPLAIMTHSPASKRRRFFPNGQSVVADFGRSCPAGAAREDRWVGKTNWTPRRHANSGVVCSDAWKSGARVATIRNSPCMKMRFSQIHSPNSQNRSLAHDAVRC